MKLAGHPLRLVKEHHQWLETGQMLTKGTWWWTILNSKYNEFCLACARIRRSGRGWGIPTSFRWNAIKGSATSRAVLPITRRYYRAGKTKGGAARSGGGRRGERQVGQRHLRQRESGVGWRGLASVKQLLSKQARGGWTRGCGGRRGRRGCDCVTSDSPASGGAGSSGAAAGSRRGDLL